jgi:hypothetical protein
MKCSYLNFLICVLIISCSEQRAQRKAAETIIEKEKMINILTDMHIVEAANSMRLIADSNKTVPIAPYQLEIFKKYNVSKTKFDSSLKYYSENHMQLNNIYDEVINEISLRQAKLEK